MEIKLNITKIGFLTAMFYIVSAIILSSAFIAYNFWGKNVDQQVLDKLYTEKMTKKMLIEGITDIAKIDSILVQAWKLETMGESGEIYMVDESYRMVTTSRFTNEKPVVNTVATRKALKEMSGGEIVDDYRGIPVYSSYSFLIIDGKKYAILSEIDVAEIKAQTLPFRVIFFIFMGTSIISIMMFFLTLREIKSDAKKFKTVFNTVLDCMIIINERGIIENANGRVQELFGYNISEILGKNVKMLMPEPYHSNHDQYVKNYINTGEKKVIGRTRAVKGLHRDGHKFNIILTANEMYLDGKRKFVGVIRDTTDLEDAKETAERKNRQLETVAFLVRHDMVGALDYIEYGIKSINSRLDEDKIKELKIDVGMKMLNGGKEQAVRILKGVRAWTNIIKGEGKLKKEVFNGGITLKAALKLDDDYHRVTQWDLGLVEADNELFAQAFVNLIKNGIKYNPKKEKTIKLYREGDVLIVEDNGGAFDPSKFEELKKPFQRGDSDVDGTGLGMAIVDGVCDLHGWKFEVEVEPGVHTRFKITINHINLKTNEK